MVFRHLSERADRTVAALHTTGSWLLYKTAQFPETSRIIKRDATTAREDTLALPCSDMAFMLSISRDGRWIAYRVKEARQKTGSSIRVIRANGTGKRIIFYGEIDPSAPQMQGPKTGEPYGPLVWSPDSRWLVFSRHGKHGNAVWRVDVKTGRAVPVTRTEAP